MKNLSQVCIFSNLFNGVGFELVSLEQLFFYDAHGGVSIACDIATLSSVLLSI